MACDLLPPHKLVTSDVLKSWAKARWGKEMPACSKTLWRILNNNADSMKNKIGQYFANSSQPTAFCCDEWTSSNGKRFMNINYHGPKESISLGLARIDVHANAENLGNILLDHLKSFQIDRPTVITTDGASVMKSMALKKNIINQLCQLHGLNLAITDVLYKHKNYVAMNSTPLDRFDEEDNAENIEQEFIPIPEMHENFSQTIRKVRDTMKQFKYGKKRDDLQKLVLAENSTEIPAEIDCTTRWNSLLPMLGKFKKLRKYIQLYLIQHDEMFDFDAMDFELIDDIINVLTPVEVAINTISSNDCNLMMADIAMTTCLSSLGLLGESNLAQNVKAALIARYNERRGEFSDVLWYLEGMEGLTSSSANLFYRRPAESTIINLANKLEVSRVSQVNLNPMEIARNPKAAKIDNSEYAGLVLFLKTIKPSSISSERAFSVCSRINIPVRGNMADSNFCMLLFLNENYRNFSK